MQIVYYSLTGHAERIARQLAEMLDVPLFRISDLRPRHGITGFIRAALEARRGKCPEITMDEAFVPDSRHIVLVAPVWAGRMNSPLRTFTQKYGKSVTRFSLVLTHADPKIRFEEICHEIVEITGAECLVFESFWIENINPAGITALGSQLAETDRKIQ